MSQRQDKHPQSLCKVFPVPNYKGAIEKACALTAWFSPAIVISVVSSSIKFFEWVLDLFLLDWKLLAIKYRLLSNAVKSFCSYSEVMLLIELLNILKYQGMQFAVEM